MAATKKLRYALDEDQHTAGWETGADVEYEEASLADVDEVVDVEYELTADSEYDDSVQVDFEELADPDYGDEVVVEFQEDVMPALPAAASQLVEGFSYELGRTVLPVTQAQAHPVVWRGYLKERHPATGFVQRIPVYRLADGFWYCYREEDLRVA